MKELDRVGGFFPPRRDDRKRKKGGGRYAAPGGGGPKKGTRRFVLRRPWRLLGLLAAVCALVCAFIVLDYLTTEDGEILRGVEASGTPVGGMTEAEARDAIAGQAGAAFDEIAFESGQDAFALPGKDLGVTVDAAAAAREAYAVGRTGGPFQRLSDTLGSYLGGGVAIAAEAGYDREAARDALEGLAREEFNREPKDASLSAEEGGEVAVAEGRDGRALDAEATLANLERKLDQFGSEGGGGPVALVVEEKAPGLTTEDARALAPTELVGEYKTDYAWDPDKGRQANLRMASKAVDNTLLAPGEVFSFAEQAGNLDYEEAKVFSDGGVATEEGGGLCQVSSTLFMAANYAGLEIVERHPHYAELPYIKPGFDATVWFGDWEPMDMKFKNTTDGYLLVREFVDKDDYLNAQIYAAQPTGNKVIMNTEKVEQSTSEGIRWVTYKKIYGPDGAVLFDDVMYEGLYSYNPPVPEELKHETNEVRVSGWIDPQNTTGWAEVD